MMQTSYRSSELASPLLEWLAPIQEPAAQARVVGFFVVFVF